MWKLTSKDENKPSESFYPEATHIGKSIVIKGEVSGSGKVYVAGELKGIVELLEGNLTRLTASFAFPLVANSSRGLIARQGTPAVSQLLSYRPRNARNS
jgi:hypothetical protein